jgi:glycosyltransferase involved in cell wall biosynthesis
MKILQIAPIRFDCVSGVSIYVMALLRELALNAGVKVGAISSLPSDLLMNEFDVPECLLIKGFPHYHKNPWHIDSSYLNKIEKEFGKPDLVHFHGVYCPMQSALARQMGCRGWKYIVSPHGGLQPASQRRKAWKKLLGNILFFDAFIRHATAIYVLNEAESIAVKQRYPKAKTIIVPNGVPAKILFNTVSSKPIKQNSQLKFGFIGRIDIDHKGIDLLLKSLLLLEKNEPTLLWQLILVGNFFTVKDENIARGLIKKFKDTTRVILTGHLKGQAKWEMLNNFDVFVHTSRYEGMPTSVIEAMALRKPCLVTPGSNMQSVIKNCDGGWLVDGNVKSIANQIQYIFEHQDEILIKGANAQKYVYQHLTWNRVAEDYINKVAAILRK